MMGTLMIPIWPVISSTMSLYFVDAIVSLASNSGACKEMELPFERLVCSDAIEGSLQSQ